MQRCENFLKILSFGKILDQKVTNVKILKFLVCNSKRVRLLSRQNNSNKGKRYFGFSVPWDHHQHPERLYCMPKPAVFGQRLKGNPSVSIPTKSSRQRKVNRGGYSFSKGSIKNLEKLA